MTAVTDWGACYTESTDGGVERGDADPLGLRAAANRLAGSLFSPVTARTTSVRQLGLFLICAQASGTTTVNVGRAALMSRALTIGCVHAASQSDADRTLLLPIRELPGQRQARVVTNRIRKGTATDQDVRVALLKSERARGLWGGYATFAERLGFLERTPSTLRLSASGHLLANKTSALLFRNVRDTTLRAMATEPSLVDVMTLSVKCTESLEPSATARACWPAHQNEVQVVRQALLGWHRGATVLALIGAAGQSGDLFPRLERDERLAHLMGARSQRIGHLADLAGLARRAVNRLEPAFRAYMRGDEKGSCPPLQPYQRLFAWCQNQGLDAGFLAGAPSEWASLMALHVRLFRRRGRRPWRDYDESELALIAPSGGPADLRVAALTRLARDGLIPAAPA